MDTLPEPAPHYEHVRPVRVGINDAGLRVGEGHPNARHPDSLVSKLRDLHEQYGYGWRRLARHFGLHPGTVRDWLRYSRRAQVPVDYRKIEE